MSNIRRLDIARLMFSENFRGKQVEKHWSKTKTSVFLGDIVIDPQQVSDDTDISYIDDNIFEIIRFRVKVASRIDLCKCYSW